MKLLDRLSVEQLRSLADWPKFTSTIKELEKEAAENSKFARSELKGLLQKHFSLQVQKEQAMICAWATGIGKTRAATTAMNDIGGKWLIVHFMDVHKNTWLDEKITADVTFVTYKSLAKYKNQIFDGIILDEGHHISPANLIALNEIGAEYKIILSATIPSEKKELMYQWCNTLKVNKIEVQDGINRGLLPRPKIILCPMTLDKTEPTEIYDFVKRKGGFWKTITYKYFVENPAIHAMWTNYHITCTPQEKHDLLTGDILHFSKLYFAEKEIWQNTRWQQANMARKTFLSNVKQKATRRIHEIFKESEGRYLVFAHILEQLQELTACNIVHSKMKNNQRVIDDFNAKKINSIFTIEMLTESQNLVEIDYVLIGTLNTNQSGNFQKFGRSLRGELPIIVIPYVKGTIDEKNMQKFIGNMAKWAITITSPSELRTNGIKRKD